MSGSSVSSSAAPRPGSENVIEIRDLTKRFGHDAALRNITFNVPRGQVLGAIGPNGAGKTTTMRILLDIVRPSSGQLRVLGEEPHGAGPEVRRRIGYLPGELILDGRSTGQALLHHYAEISGPVRPGRIRQLTDRFDVDLSRQVRKLSKGNKQKLGIIQAFMHDPELLVLDEPTSGLDPLMQQEFLRLVREAQNAGQSVLLSSHVISEIQQASDSVVILRKGEVVSRASVTELRDTAMRRLRLRTTASTEEIQ
ncbi:ABC transporter ATP-binding protein [Acaricomes phytoseiuli]|uniref:ABC transporter ATP-binding protein n=1 Tax=Acaricomes phytoseiuli TaxID=291968 RepID=UPI002221EC3C|nr:ABC transporter ATP-binding protein [Acaricomes phytoseiuli]MCW1250124.1 ABC transporter ATP-binding protein [Acaricomes phytoseiuli]